jgi:hypothetical protein
MLTCPHGSPIVQHQRQSKGSEGRKEREGDVEAHPELDAGLGGGRRVRRR